MSRYSEGRPWELTTQAGYRNYGSYEFGAVAGTTHLAHDLLQEAGHDVLDPELLGAVTDALLLAADLAMGRLTKGSIDRMAATHTRCRASVRSAVDLNPLPEMLDTASLRAWGVTVADAATAHLMVAADPARSFPQVQHVNEAKKVVLAAATSVVDDPDAAKALAVQVWTDQVSTIDGEWVHVSEVDAAVAAIEATRPTEPEAASEADPAEVTF